MKDNLTIILPAFNEQGHIEEVVRDSMLFVRRHVKEFELIVVDDGSMDNTLTILNKMRSIYPELKVIS
ncbi:glycosyltransferase, partial [Candidatus Omnitrophota bacterium]